MTEKSHCDSLILKNCSLLGPENAQYVTKSKIKLGTSAFILFISHLLPENLVRLLLSTVYRDVNHIRNVFLKPGNTRLISLKSTSPISSSFKTEDTEISITKLFWKLAGTFNCQLLQCSILDSLDFPVIVFNLQSPWVNGTEEIFRKIMPFWYHSQRGSNYPMTETKALPIPAEAVMGTWLPGQAIRSFSESCHRTIMGNDQPDHSQPHKLERSRPLSLLMSQPEFLHHCYVPVSSSQTEVFSSVVPRP